MKVQIKLQRYGEQGWQWTETTEDFNERTGEFGDITTEYRTNRNGEGLWYWRDASNEWKQTMGTCQFSLASTRSAAYSKIRRLALRDD